MNTVTQTIAKLIILPLFGGALITGVAIGTADSAAATTKVTGVGARRLRPSRARAGTRSWMGRSLPPLPRLRLDRTWSSTESGCPRGRHPVRPARTAATSDKKGRRQVQQGQFRAPVSVAIVTKAPVQ